MPDQTIRWNEPPMQGLSEVRVLRRDGADPTPDTHEVQATVAPGTGEYVVPEADMVVGRRFVVVGVNADATPDVLGPLSNVISVVATGGSAFYAADHPSAGAVRLLVLDETAGTLSRASAGDDWTEVSDPSYVGGTAMQAPTQNTTIEASQVIPFEVTPEEAGQPLSVHLLMREAGAADDVHVWLHDETGGLHDGTSNEQNLGVVDLVTHATGQREAGGTWARNNTTFTRAAGTYRLRIEHRGNAVIIDRVVIATTDADMGAFGQNGPAPGDAGVTLSFGDDFGADGDLAAPWEAHLSDSQVTGGQLALAADSMEVIQPLSPASADMALVGYWTPGANSRNSVVLRAHAGMAAGNQDNDGYLFFNLRVPNQDINLYWQTGAHNFKEGRTNGPVEIATGIAYPWTAGQKYRIEARAKGVDLELYVDPVAAAGEVVESPTLVASGPCAYSQMMTRAGLRRDSSDGLAVWEQVRVYALDYERPEWDGQFPALTKSGSNPVVTGGTTANVPEEWLWWTVKKASDLGIGSPLDTYYAYYSSDHVQANGGIYLATAPGRHGPWTDQGQVYVDTVDGFATETPEIVYDGATIHLFYHNVNAPSNGVQSTLRATSTDGVNWTRQGYALTADAAFAATGKPSNDLAGHMGYMRVMHHDGALFHAISFAGDYTGASKWPWTRRALHWTSPDLLTWTRQGFIDFSFMAALGYDESWYVHEGGTAWFEHDGGLYMASIIRQIDAAGAIVQAKIIVLKCALAADEQAGLGTAYETFAPVAAEPLQVDTATWETDDVRIAGAYAEGSTLDLWYQCVDDSGASTVVRQGVATATIS